MTDPAAPEPTAPEIDEIYRYWFGDLREDSHYFSERTPLWFGSAPETDSEIALRFGALLERSILPGGDGIDPEFLRWTRTPRGRIALIVLIDQFSLQLYRERPESYDRSALVVPIAKEAIDLGIDRSLSVSERLFLYLPLEHSENVEDQELSVRSFESLVRDSRGDSRTPAEGFLDYARRHSDVVHRFGRFPDRNPVYGRPNTPDEEAFLRSDEAPF